MEIEHFFTCPHCWQMISMILDLSIAEQNYVEDCEVCCNPIQINFTVQDLDLKEFEANDIEQ
jgi:transcription elongation factor Elf1